MIIPPSCLLSEPDRIAASDRVMVAYFAPTQRGEEPRVVRVELSLVVEAIGFLTVDPIESEASAERVPTSRLISLQRNLRRNVQADKARRSGFITEDDEERPAAVLADHDSNLPLA